MKGSWQRLVTWLEIAMEEPKKLHDADSNVASLNERKGLARGVYLLPNLITTGALFS